MAYAFDNDKSKIDVYSKDENNSMFTWFESDWTSQKIAYGSSASAIIFLTRLGSPNDFVLTSCEYQFAENTADAHTWYPLINGLASAGGSTTKLDSIYYHDTLGTITVTKYNNMSEGRYIRFRGLLVNKSHADTTSVIIQG